jgi:segregation and condensation protein B
MNTEQKIESILLVSPQGVSVKELTKLLKKEKEDVVESVKKLQSWYTADRGIAIQITGEEVRLVTNPACAEIIAQYTKQEMGGELTRPQLETLTVVAYKGPITKSEIEQIRGINCTMIVRNLLMRGLIVEEEGSLESVYRVSLESLSLLGITNVEELPDYEKLHTQEIPERNEVTV